MASEPLSECWNPMVPELLVSDFSKSLRFYCDVLGFRVRHQRQSPDFAYLEHEQLQLMLEQLEPDSWLTGPLQPPLGRGINLQMELSDIMPVYQRLQQAKVPLFRELDTSWYDIDSGHAGQLEFLVQDPDGYLLRFSQYLGDVTPAAGQR